MKKNTTENPDTQPEEFKPFSRRLSEYETRTIDWLWQSRIPIGCITLVEGDGGIGKSYVLASIASSITNGSPLPHDVAKAPQSVLMLAVEDDPAVVLRPRFEHHNANLDLVRCYDQSMLLNQEGLARLEREIREFNVKLVVIDPIVSFLGQTIDTSKATDVRSVMGPLHQIANRNECAIIVVRHWTKNTMAQASQRGSGSVDFRNSARSVLQIIKSGDERYLALEKSNYNASCQTLKFKILDSKIEWTGSSDASADEILSELRSSYENPSELEDAVEFVRETVSQGPVESKSLEQQARDLGISSSTLKRAKRKLNIKAFKMKGDNKWLCDYGDEDQNRGSGSGFGAQEPGPHPPLTLFGETNAI